MEGRPELQGCPSVERKPSCQNCVALRDCDLAHVLLCCMCGMQVTSGTAPQQPASPDTEVLSQTWEVHAEHSEGAEWVKATDAAHTDCDKYAFAACYPLEARITEPSHVVNTWTERISIKDEKAYILAGSEDILVTQTEAVDSVCADKLNICISKVEESSQLQSTKKILLCENTKDSTNDKTRKERLSLERRSSPWKKETQIKGIVTRRQSSRLSTCTSKGSHESKRISSKGKPPVSRTRGRMTAQKHNSVHDKKHWRTKKPGEECIDKRCEIGSNSSWLDKEKSHKSNRNSYNLTDGELDGIQIMPSSLEGSASETKMFAPTGPVEERIDHLEETQRSVDSSVEERLAHLGQPWQHLFPCGICGKGLKHRRNIIAHLKKVHGKEAPFRCELCGFFYLDKQGLEAHNIRIHQKKSDYMCSFCGRVFKNGSSYFKHLRRSHDDRQQPPKKTSREKTSVCEVCGKQFAFKISLLGHLKSHEERKPKQLSCGICEKQFPSSSKLQVHMRVHSNERPYQCRLCRKEFRQPTHLKTHMKSHTGEKHFLCGLCGRRFTLLVTLQRHLRIHTGERPYKCERCAKTFIQPSGLISHKKKCVKNVSMETSDVKTDVLQLVAQEIPVESEECHHPMPSTSLIISE